MTLYHGYYGRKLSLESTTAITSSQIPLHVSTFQVQYIKH